jgi:AcrR family transcriptional regulator
MNNNNSNIDESHLQHPYHHGNLRPMLIQEALKILSTDGMSGLTLRKVAKSAGFSHAAPAHHFRDKNGLLAAVAAEGFRMLAAELLCLTKSHQNSKDQVKICVKTYVSFAQREIQLFRLIFGPLDININDYPELYEAGLLCWNVLLDIITHFIKDYHITTTNAELLSFCIWAHTQGIASLIVNQSVIPPDIIPLKEAMLDKSLDLLIAGLIADSNNDIPSDPIR